MMTTYVALCYVSVASWRAFSEPAFCVQAKRCIGWQFENARESCDNYRHGTAAQNYPTGKHSGGIIISGVQFFACYTLFPAL